MHRPTRATFADGPASAREPCVLTGLDLGPAPWTWSPEHLASKPGVASAEVSVHVSASPHLDFVRKNFAFENVAFGEFLSRLRDEGPGPVTESGKETGKKWYYLRSIGANPRKEPAHALAQWRPAREAREEGTPAATGTGTGTASADVSPWVAIMGDPMGYLDDAECDRALAACVRALALTRPASAGPGPAGPDADPGATIADAKTSDADTGPTQAALQLLAHLTKRHARAKWAMDRGCAALLLDLPRRFAFPAYDALAAAIFRHAMEDAATLQAAMESEIHATMNAPGLERGGGAPRGSRS